MIKILHINSALGRGGAALIMSDLCEGLNARGEFQADMLVGVNYSDKPSPNVKTLLSPGEYYLNVLITRLTGMDSTWLPLDHSKKIKKFIADYDIIHLHNLHGYYFQLKYLDLLKDKKVVWSLHDFWSITGRCCSPIECKKWKNTCGQCPHLDYYPRSLFFDLSALNNKLKRKAINNLQNLYMVSVSHALEKTTKQANLKPKDWSVIHDGVNPSIFNASSNGGLIKKEYAKKRKILVVAPKISISSKGFDIFAKSLSFIPNHEKAGYHLIIVGENNQRLLERYFPGFTYTSFGYIGNQSELAQIYSIADLCVQPSLSESFGKVTVESMLCETPVVAFKYDIMEEIIGEEKLLVEMQGDLAQALHLKIKEFFERLIYLPELSDSNIKQRGLVFSIDKMVGGYASLYKKI